MYTGIITEGASCRAGDAQRSLMKKREQNTLKVASLNIGTGLYSKEELLINTLMEQDIDIFGVSEVDIEHFDEKKPFSIKGYQTFFSLERFDRIALIFRLDAIHI